MLRCGADSLTGVVPGEGRMKMATESDVLSEIEVLQSIYLEELRVSRKSDRDWDVSVDLYPSTAEDSLSQFVRLTLTLTMDSQYPSSAPSISIHNPRGLSDDKLLSVRRCLEAEAQACLGTPVLYQLIQKAKEILTESNIPHGSCVICLYGFKDGEVFTKTGCYHYFHSHCLGRYAAHSESELQERAREREEDKTRGRMEGQELSVVCPVCREPLTYDLEVLLNSPTPHFPKTEETVLGPEFRKKWAKLQSVLERQRERGGVIDPEAESSRFLIHINQPPADAGSVAPDPDSPPSPPLPASIPPSTNQVTASQGPQPSSQSERRAGSGGRRRGQSKWSRRREAQPEPRGLSEEGVAKLSLSSGRDPARQPRPAETARAERSGEISRPHAVAHDNAHAVAHGDGQQHTLNQSCPDILKSNSQADPMPGRGRGQRHGQWGRGRRRGSGQQPRRLDERHVHGPDAPREGAPHWGGRGGGYRGRRGTDHYTHFRGGGDNRKSGRGFTQREADSEVAGGEGP
ncbi:E3 ubiquitin-protein ligase RNF25 isoform X2 [Conger conger]|uniref:E3 ubiquitin-protein ligase RNF25 isoform X2 n=1 Tax=Conger conger TaxID=82655 RepID=UPI002A59DF80|nr:E3 ubiquitin-protein ligase RNF25 isoform X2 [Conger conger]